MGFFDNDPFDFNGDGKRSIDEDFMEYMMYKECTKSFEDEEEMDAEEDDDDFFGRD